MGRAVAGFLLAAACLSGCADPVDVTTDLVPTAFGRLELIAAYKEDWICSTAAYRVVLADFDGLDWLDGARSSRGRYWSASQGRQLPREYEEWLAGPVTDDIVSGLSHKSVLFGRGFGCGGASDGEHLSDAWLHQPYFYTFDTGGVFMAYVPDTATLIVATHD